MLWGGKGRLDSACLADYALWFRSQSWVQLMGYLVELFSLLDLDIAERKILLTYVLRILADKGLLAQLAFKGGTAIRKLILSELGRFSSTWISLQPPMWSQMRSCPAGPVALLFLKKKVRTRIGTASQTADR